MAKKELNNSNNNDKKMRTKDLIYAGAFGAIYLVLMLIVVMGSSMIPVLYLIAPFTVGLVCATVYELCVIKVHKFGAALILGVLFPLVACMQYLPGFICAVVFALISELIIKAGNYKSRKMYLISFIVFNLNMCCPYMLLWFDKNTFLEYSASYYGESYVTALNSYATNYLMFIQIALAIIGAIGGLFIANKLINKHFEKAGVI